MGMNVGSSSSDSDEPMMEMNMTPLIDVMLVLIIMLIITIPIQNHAVKLNMPTGNPPPPVTMPSVVNIGIDPTGTVMWNDDTLTSREELEQHFKTIVASGNIDEVHIRPDKLVAYKFVASVLASAQRLGVTKIGIVGNEKLMD